MENINQKVENAFNRVVIFPEYERSEELIVVSYSRAYFYTSPCALEISFKVRKRIPEDGNGKEAHAWDATLPPKPVDDSEFINPPTPEEREEFQRKRPIFFHVYVLFTIYDENYLHVKVMKTNADHDVVYEVEE